MWKKISTKKLLEHPRLTVYEDTVKLPDGSVTKYIHYTSGKDAVSIICTDEDRILLQEEYSYPTGEILYQFPGGGIEEGETALQAAKRELAEESALAGTLQEIGWFYIDNRRSDKKMFVFQALDCKSTPNVSGDKEEMIQSQWKEISELKELINNGKIVNYSLLAALALYQNGRNRV